MTMSSEETQAMTDLEAGPGSWDGAETKLGCQHVDLGEYQ